MRLHLKAPFYLTTAILSWFIFSAIKNNIAKVVVSLNNIPVTITLLQSLVMALCATINALKMKPNLYTLIYMVLPIAIVTTGGNVVNQIGLRHVSVSFQHTIKATSPVFALVLSYIFMKKRFSRWMVLCIIPIVGGVVLSSMHQVSFDLFGVFWTLMATFVYTAANLRTKVLLSKFKVTRAEFLAIMCWVSTLISLPIWVVNEMSVMGEVSYYVLGLIGVVFGFC